MADQEPQNFDNHVVFPTPAVTIMVVMLVSVIMAVVGLFMVKSTAGICLIGTAAAVNGLASIAMMMVARGYSTKLQDRIVRTEMQVRLEKILPEEMQSEIPKLTIKQRIGLRFASDEEMSDLIRKVLSENIEMATPIKKEVKNWQPDHYRV